MAERTTDQIHEDIYNLSTNSDIGDGYPYAELGRLWREMARAGIRENQPRWATLAAALLADDYDRRAEERDHRRATGDVTAMIEASSLGTTGAKAVRDSTPATAARAIVERSKKIGDDHAE